METAAWLRPARLFAIGVALIVVGGAISYGVSLRFYSANFSSEDGAEYAIYGVVGTTASDTLRLVGIGIVLIALARLVFPTPAATPAVTVAEPATEATESESSDVIDEPDDDEFFRSAPEALEFGGPDHHAAPPDQAWARRPGGHDDR